MNELNVCMFGSELAPSKGGVYIGGSVVSAINLAKHLGESEINVSIYTTRPRDWESYQPVIETDWGHISIADINAKDAGVLTNAIAVGALTRGLVAHCREHDVDVIHSHSGFPVVSLIPVLSGRRLNVPVVHSLYCPVPQDRELSPKKRLSSPFFTRRLLGRTEHVFAMSRNVADSLRDSGISDISVLPPIVDCETYTPDREEPESIEVHERKLSVLFVGNLKPEKGLEHLVEAAGKVSESTPVQLIVTTERDFSGSSEREQTIESLAHEVGIADDIERLGIIPDMPQLLANVDVLALPFVSTEGPSDYPLVALEAMATGTPVVGSSIGGIKELLDDDRGFLVPPADSRALADGILEGRQMTDANRARAREYIETTFSSEAVYDQVVGVYEEVL